MDWQTDVAIEMGIITQEQATEEMQSRLEKFEKACVDNYTYSNESRVVGHYPKTILEDEHVERVKAVESEAQGRTNRLTSQVKDLERIIERKNDIIYDLKQDIQNLRSQSCTS